MKNHWRIIGALIALLATSEGAFASATRTIDAAAINNDGATLTLPSTTDTIVGRASTDTLTNKTLTSPTINTPSISGSGGALTLPAGPDTLVGRATTDTLTNKTLTAPVLGGTVTGTYTLGGTPTIPTSGLSGQVSVSNGGTGSSSLTSGSVVVGNGTAAVSLVAPGTSGNVLTSNGSTWTSSAPASVAPTITGSTGTPTAITAVGGISFSGTAYSNVNFVTGSGGAVTVTANPQIAAATNVGQQLVLYGNSDTNTVTLADGNGLSLNGPVTLKNHSIISLIWDGTVWAELSRR